MSANLAGAAAYAVMAEQRQAYTPSVGDMARMGRAWYRRHGIPKERELGLTMGGVWYFDAAGSSHCEPWATVEAEDVAAGGAA